MLINEALTARAIEPHEDDPIWAVVEHAVGFPTPAKMAEVRRQYLSAERRLVAFEINGVLVGALGFEEAAPKDAIMEHIAVAVSARGQGVGRDIVRWLCSQGFAALRAETHADAVGFYERCGFEVERFVDGRFPDTARFRCVLWC